jgi:hypothetical protein
MAGMQYAVLFRIECLHAYFGGGPCRGMTLTPTDDCRRMLARYQMLFRSEAGGGSVYCTKQSPPDLLKQFDEIAAFTFALTSTDPILNNYTDCDLSQLDPTGSIFHFDNRADYAKETFGQLRHLLHQPGKPFAEPPVPVRTKISSVAPVDATGGGDFKIIEPLTNQIVCQATFPPRGEPAQADLRKFAEGMYLLQVNDKPPKRFYLSDQSAVRNWGVISIYAGGSRQATHLPDNCRALDSNGVTDPKTFTLALETRKTIWRYYIIPSAGQQNFSQYELAGTSKKAPGSSTASENEFQFALLPETTPVDGRTAWVFESKAALPFLSSPANAFSLSLRPNKNGKTGQRAIRLPYAQPSSLAARPGVEPREMCSEVFVYV